MTIHKCPVCDSDSTVKLHSFSAEDAINHLTSDIKRKVRILGIIKDLWKSDEVDIRKCKNCDFEFSYPFISGNAEYYSVVYDETVTYPITKWEFERSFDTIKKLKNPKLTLLEIGAGDGGFLDIVSQSLAKENLYSTEYSSYGKEKIEHKGYTCYQKSLIEIKEEIGRKINIVCMFQVLEHMDNLKEIFKNIQYITKDEAHIFIAVPNAIQRSFFDKYEIYLDIPPTHIGRFYKNTIKKICKDYQWTLIDAEIEPMTYKKKVSKFLISRYWKNTKALKFEKKIKNKVILKIGRLIFFSILALRYIKVLIYLKSGDLGTSSWFYIYKNHAIVGIS